MEPIIKPIETVYQGYRFRSRLEARWAVFFDTAGIQWEYEKEGFELSDGTRYLPDFWLPDHHSWVEIKPEADTPQQLEKVQQFAEAIEREYQAARAEYAGRPPNPIATQLIVLTEELFNLSQRLHQVTEQAVTTLDNGDHYIPRMFHLACQLFEYSDELCQMECAINPLPDLPPSVYVCQGGPYRSGMQHAYNLTCLCPMNSEPRWWVEREGGTITIGSLRSAIQHSERLTRAYTAARQARFEHGERGRRS